MLQVLMGAATAAALLAAAYDTATRTPALQRSAASASAARSAPAAASPGPQGAGRHEQGRAIYNFRCYFCHGYSGDARTLAATYVDPPPRNFQAASPADLPRARIESAVRDGRPGTAMKGFAGILSADEIAAVAGFVADEFVQRKAGNTRYHTAANGWPSHDRHLAAPFARGDIALDTPTEQLDERQREGRRLFMGACVSCHDRARTADEGPAWSARPVSYPRLGFVPGQHEVPVDAVSSASVYAKHEVVPRIAGLDAREQEGESLFQANCAFCHAADGTGKNWIGQFMEPKARDLTQYSVHSLPPQRLQQVIRDGLPGTSMPAWSSVLTPTQVEAVTAYVSRAFLRSEPAPR